MIKVFISYSHIDETYRLQLEKHLSVLKRNGYIDTWTDKKIMPGEEWEHEISRELLHARVILLLISSDFLASDYCYDIEMKAAVARHNEKAAIVIPIILRFCDWSNTPFAKLQGLPSNGKPIKDWNDIDSAFLNVVEGIKVAIHAISNNSFNWNSTFELTPKEQLADLRRRTLSARNARDFRELMYNLLEYKKIHPLSFELQELEQKIRTGLEYESRPLPNMPPPPLYRYKRILYIVIGLIAIIAIILILIKLL